MLWAADNERVTTMSARTQSAPVHTPRKRPSRRRRQRRRNRFPTRLVVLLLLIVIVSGFWRGREPEDSPAPSPESVPSETTLPPTGWQTRDGAVYYLYPDGTTATGLTEVEGRQYYFGEDGARYTGWLTLDGVTRFFRTDGSMAVGKIMIDDSARYFSSSGAYVVMVNRWNPVPGDYSVNLVPFGEWQVSDVCYDALTRMLGDCPYGYVISSAYRSTEEQQTLWTTRLNGYRNAGYSEAAALAEVEAYVSPPGYSEHQLGLALDISGSDEVCGWLSEHSWEYGFILRYPEGKSDITGIAYERWHFRYLGEALAAEIHQLDITLEEYLDLCTADALSDTGTASNPERYTNCAAGQ